MKGGKPMDKAIGAAPINNTKISEPKFESWLDMRLQMITQVKITKDSSVTKDYDHMDVVLYEAKHAPL